VSNRAVRGDQLGSRSGDARVAPRRVIRGATLAIVTAVTLTLAACTSTKTPSAGQGSVSTSPAGVVLSTPTPNSGGYDPETDPVVQAVQKVEPAVVNVTTNIVQQNPFGGSSVGKGVGTGFVVRQDGIVITNFHVVEGGLQIRVRFNGTAPEALRGKLFGAHVIGEDNARDIAILQLDGVTTYEPLPTVPLGDSAALVVGERVIAIGYALALPGGPTVTSGILSSTARTVQVQDANTPRGSRTYEDALQTDAAINPGNSGGPLIDLNGNVIGINTAGSNSAQNIGFAIAINSVKALATRSIAHPAETVAYLGVSTEPVSAVPLGAPVDHGAVVVALAPAGPGAKAGIRVGDIIITFDGKRVTGPTDLGTDIHSHRPGDRVVVQVVHQGGGTETVNVTLGTNPLPSSG
jgi:S1-C subfamily serine protease